MSSPNHFKTESIGKLLSTISILLSHCILELNTEHLLAHQQETNNQASQEIAPTSKKRKIENVYSWSNIISEHFNCDFTNKIAWMLIIEQFLKYNYARLPLIYLRCLHDFIVQEEKIITEESVYFKFAKISDQTSIKDFQKAYINSCLSLYAQNRKFSDDLLAKIITFCLANASTDFAYYLRVIYELLMHCTNKRAFIKPIIDLFLTLHSEHSAISVFEMNTDVLHYLANILDMMDFEELHVIEVDYKKRIISALLPSMGYLHDELEGLLADLDKTDQDNDDERGNFYNKQKSSLASSSLNNFKRCVNQFLCNSNVKRTSSKSNSYSISTIINALVHNPIDNSESTSKI